MTLMYIFINKYQFVYRMSTKKDRENKQYVYKSGRKKRRKVLSKEEKSKLRAAALRRSRGPKDPCLVPDRFLYRLNVSFLNIRNYFLNSFFLVFSHFQVGPDGAMVVTFSNSGHLLASECLLIIFFFLYLFEHF